MLRASDPEPSPLDDAAKRFFDLLVGIELLVISAPLFGVVGLLIKRDDGGSVFFTQPRLGRGGVPFRMWKFRTMREAAADLRNPDGSTYNADDDPRVTRIGRFLRKTSLDELPQLINVVRGEMSLVGPRPDLVDQLQHYRTEDHARLSVRPGITGWAQVRGRNELSWERRRDLDLEYVRRRSFAFDLAILVRTVPLVLQRRGIFAGRAARLDPTRRAKPTERPS